MPPELLTKRTFKSNPWVRVRNAERSYAAKLRSIARHIDILVRGFFELHTIPQQSDFDRLITILNRYSETLRPWAHSVGARMAAEVDRREWSAWMQHSRAIGESMRAEIEHAPTGRVFREAIERQADLITSLPRDAAIRVQKLAIEAITSGERYPSLAREILDTGHVTASRANLIAQTEISRAATEFTRARSEHVGSTHYTWLTARDGRVRASHRKLDGQVFAWHDPPLSDPPRYRAHPGQIFRCRCVPLPIIPDMTMGMAA